MYPHVIQFETRFRDVERRYQLARERADALRDARPRRRRSRPRLSLRALGGGASAGFA